jgi:crotonobetainyl-CoA:carnitine CoA-transferase CaiB-like acyl-CoA transferase
VNLTDCMDLHPADLTQRSDRPAWPAVRERFPLGLPHADARRLGRGGDRPGRVQSTRRSAWPSSDARAERSSARRSPSPAHRLSRTDSNLRRPTPWSGQDGRDALSDWGFSEADIARLESAGAAAQG